MKQKNDQQQSEQLISRPITEELKQSYLDYAMSVIVSRALPDVRDGFKPVHRRILYSMWKTGLKSTAKFRKSATVVGEVLGKYHPHGDSAVYDSMVRMAQEWSLRYPLVWGQGNFGSMDGDGAAAYRYTEAKLQPIAEEMLVDIEKETVDFRPNFDGSHDEPTVLPAKLPQLLLNGTVGIAVGMATNIPPHNFNELVDAILHIIDHPKADVDDLMQFVKGPDFPTGGIIYNTNDIREVYATGRGRIAMRAAAEIVETRAGAFQIIISEVTYQTNKASLIEKIAHLVKDGKIVGIKNLRDESDKDGVRIAIDLKKEAQPQKVLNTLYKLTDLQKNFSANMLALVDGIEPRILTLKEMLTYYIAHREDVVTRRTQFDLRKAKDRAHILEGLVKALDHIDEVIKVIKQSKTREIAHDNLMKRFQFSERQATAILEMRLQTLAGLERKKIEDELKEKMKLIAYLESILKSHKKLMGIIKEELRTLRDTYGDARKTRVIAGGVDTFSLEDLIPNEEAIITISVDGYVKRVAPSQYRAQRRGGKGVIGATTKEGDEIATVASVMTHDNLLFFTSTGKVFQMQAHEIPESTRIAKGNAIVNFLELSQQEKVTAMIAFNADDQYKYFVMVTQHGTIKRVAVEDFANVRRSGLIAIKLASGDTLGWVRPTTGNDDVLLTTAQGQSIRFHEDAVRSMGRAAAGVRGIKLSKANDIVVGVDTISLNDIEEAALLVITENGFGKRTNVTAFKTQGRGGSGIKAGAVTDKTGKIVHAEVVRADDEVSDLIVTSQHGQIIRIPLGSISVLGRATQGVRLMKPKKGDHISAATIL